MRKIKTVLMIMVLGMLFISCKQYSKEPLTNQETLKLSYKMDTTKYVVVTNSDSNTTYFKVTDKGLIPEVKLFEENVAGPILFSIFLGVMLLIAGYSIGRDY